MAIITWTELYSVGVERFDQQHQKLFAIVNELHDAMSSGRGQMELKNILDQLIDYTQTHFAAEEKLMREYHYPDLEKHCQRLKELTQQVLDFKTKYDSGKIGLSIQLTQFLKDWLANHILGEDMQYSAFFQSLNIH
jgi:hemerythrin